MLNRILKSPIAFVILLFIIATFGLMIGLLFNPPPEVKTNTIVQEVRVEQSPPVCLDAIRLAREGFTIASASIEAIINSKVSALHLLNQRLEITSIEFNKAAIKCNEASQERVVSP